MNFRDIWNHPKRDQVLTGVVALGAGVGIGYFLGIRSRKELHKLPDQLEFDFDTVELSQIRDRSAIINPPIPVDARETSEETEKEVKEFLAKKLEERLYTNRITEEDVKESTPEPVTRLEVLPQPEPEIEEAISHNVFAQDDDDWDYAKELASRNPSEPYVLHRDEFFENELGLTQVTLTYYEGDDIMADEEDSPVYNYKTLVGEPKFGHGSDDPNVVYVRNARRKTEYEILKNSGMFSVEVMGLDIEENERVKDLKHSHNRKFRDEVS